MRVVKYVSDNGEFILNQNAYINIKEMNPWSSSWDYDSVERQYGVRVKKFKKKPISLKLSLRFKRDYADSLNAFFEACEKDVLSNTPARLYVDDEYIEGFVIDRTTKPSEDFYGYQQDITFFAPYPFWITEATRVFGISGDVEQDTGLDYDYDYEYDYAASNTGYDAWDTGHYAPSNFLMTIYGPCTDPIISINGHAYGVETTILDGDKVEIDSRKNTVTLVSGTHETNIFSLRNREQSIFEKIPGGMVQTLWSGTFSFTIKLFEERGEPRWK